MLFQRPAIVFNPVGGSASPALLSSLVKELATGGAHIQTLLTGPELDSARKLSEKAIAGGADLLIAVGGDGTVREVAEAAIHAKIPLAAYQGGTSNEFATSFYRRMPAAEFCRMLREGEPQALDVLELEYLQNGQIHKRISLVGICTGSVAEAITGAPRPWKRVFGSLVYAVRVIAACFNPKRQTLSLQTERKQWRSKLTTAVVLNVDQARFIPVSHACNASDGLLDLVLFEPETLIQFTSTAFWMLLNRPQRSRYYRRYRLKELSIESQETIPLNVDGEEANTKKLKIRVLPGHLRMIVSA